MGLSNELSCEAGSFLLPQPPQVFQSEVLRLYFPVLECWVAWYVSFPSCSSWFICMQTWELLVCHPPPCCESSPPWLCISAPPNGLDECFFLTPWLLDFHTVQFSGSCGYFLFLNLLSFFWLCEETKYIYLCLHLGHL